MRIGGARCGRNSKLAMLAGTIALAATLAHPLTASARPAGNPPTKTETSDPQTGQPETEGTGEEPEPTTDPSDPATPSTTEPAVPATFLCVPGDAGAVPALAVYLASDADGVAKFGDLEDEVEARASSGQPRTLEIEELQIEATDGGDAEGPSGEQQPTPGEDEEDPTEGTADDPEPTDSVDGQAITDQIQEEAQPGTIVVLIGDVADVVDSSALANQSYVLKADPAPLAVDAIVRKAANAEGASNVASIALTEDGTGAQVVDAPDRARGQTVQATSILVFLEDGSTQPCATSTLPARMFWSTDGTEPVAPVEGGNVANVVVEGAGLDGATLLASAQATEVAGLQDELAGTKEQLADAKADLQAASAGGDGGGLPTPLFFGLFVGLLAALGAIAYLLNRKPEAAPVAAGYPAGGGYGAMAPGAMGGPAGPAAPVLPARYTEAAPIEPMPVPDPAPGWTGTIPGGAAVRLEDVGLLRVVAREVNQGKAWGHETNRWVLATGWSEKVPGKGEDAEPAVRVHRSGAGILAVFDGTGGAGSASARRLQDGSDLSGAYVASRLAKEVTEAWAVERIVQGDRGLDPDDLRDRLARTLQDEAQYPNAPKSTMRGSLQRVLPTTMAAVGFVAQPDAVHVEALWAGDSRAYVLTPDGGLQVLTIDDTRETDALELIRNDQPMSNLISADKAFTVNRRRYRIASPAVLLTATDGCFGYVRTPAHFEYLVLDSLAKAGSGEDWAAELVTSLSGIAADDVSFALAAFGFESYDGIRTAFEARRSFLADHHWAPFQRVADQPAEVEALRISSWEAYRGLYHARLEEEQT